MKDFIQDGDLTDPFRSFISKSRYARWIPEYGRRETWEETVHRYADFFSAKVDLSPEQKAELIDNVLNHRVMPSMRAIMTAGEALERSNVAGYNCSFIAVDDERAFDEALYILMCGTGLGFSAEKKYVRYLPVVPEDITSSEEVIVVNDSKEGWAQGYRELIAALYRGELPKWDLRQLRPEGARLKTFGGRSSGPEPLNELFEFTVKMFAGARGRRLSSLEVHEIMCKIGAVVVVGGVRRSALISLSSLSDEDIRDAKSGNWWEEKPHLALSNNSAVYNSKPSRSDFDKEWAALVASGSGERGIFNLAGARAHVPERRDATQIAGTNPCAEILLRSRGFCNLSEVIVRAEDTLDDLKYKVEMATKIGTWQSTLTNFPYLSDRWKKNAEEERLLGVSLTGQMGHSVLNGRNGRKLKNEWLRELKKVAIATNKKEARRLGINPSAAITTVKPSGTVSTLTNTSSGMHAWHDQFYIRTVRISITDPICQFMIDAGVPAEVDFYNPKSMVFSFPFAAPEGAVTRDDMSAIDQLEMWLDYKMNWTEHSPSVTVSVREEEWAEVGDWAYEHFDLITGVSFLPHSEHTYVQAPFQTIDKEAYDKAKSTMPTALAWDMLAVYELEDTTTGSQTLSCTAGVCDVVDLVKDTSLI
jgi:ribonucleoside-diphosphate reductase alpha chain